MTIAIRQPELEAIILERMASGRFQNVEDVLLQALYSSQPEVRSGETEEEGDHEFGKRLVEVCALVQGLADDVDFTRDPSLGRELQLA